MRIEDLEIHLVSDGVVHADAGGPFGLVPRALYERYLKPDAQNHVPMALTCLLVRSEGKTILVDTGLGDKLSPEERSRWNIERPQGGLLDGLAALGLAPEAVDIVINTHLHVDHCGGNTRSAGDDLVATFPRAVYIVQRLEWADASHPDARTRVSYIAGDFDPLLRSGRMRLLHGDTQITGHIRCVVTPGHTRGHQSVVLQAGDFRGLYVADMASYAVHFVRTAWLTAYDVDPLQNIVTKQRWQRWALDHGAWLFFEHDPELSVARLREKDGRLDLEPVAEAEEATGSLPTPRPRRG
jgi:glyoxylase-like metal-dependent hydrolase (beta-lactamase superfamily II)